MTDKKALEKKVFERKIEKLAINKSQIVSAIGFHRDQMNQGITQMSQIDGKMELLRELIDEMEPKKVSKKEPTKNAKEPDK